MVFLPLGRRPQEAKSAATPVTDAIEKVFLGVTSETFLKLRMHFVRSDVERNILINPLHPDAKGITCTMPEPVWWDERLYAAR